MLDPAADLGLEEDATSAYRRDLMFQSPLSRQKQFHRRDSFAHSPFKPLKSPPGLFYGGRALDDAYMDEDEADNPFYNNHIRKFFEQAEECTVGPMFVETDGQQYMPKKDPLADAGNRNLALEQPYSKVAEESAFKSGMSSGPLLSFPEER